MDKYDRIGGKFGERLKSSIDRAEQCFSNDPTTRRCPFLNDKNLCDIITELGEDMLCDICDRHPRYFEWYDDVIEGGIGLCCEEAARLILGDNERGTYTTDAPESLAADIDEDDEPCDKLYFAFLSEAREKSIGLLSDENVPLSHALDLLVSYAAALQDRTDFYDIEDVLEFAEAGSFDLTDAVEMMQTAESMDDGQTDYLEGLLDYVKGDPESGDIKEKNVPELRNTALYFIRRYFLPAVFCGDIYPRLMLAVFGTRVINAMFNYEEHRGNDLNFEKKCALAKSFSKMIEYSEDNLDMVFEHYSYD